MKRTVKLALLGALLQSSAHAAEQSVVTGTVKDPGQQKAAAVQPAPLTAKHKSAGRKTGKHAGTRKTEPKARLKKKVEADAPSDPIEQSVQLRGVRG
ncbi:hypothetical protein [Sideroxydans lithotrophicus]|uniref:Uncharacterized protein n=1 Tax=Sideroxydans lithotrophicus (strain ES-1) TaxID=580332 RepID=D5CNR6_SIDLE|nr:hypothetical protein [Sideroxydans lithotrophicus]ADE10979.1 hypothetical protein Slit_0740 [Sideroxydans lithotrophicus ES-1]